MATIIELNTKKFNEFVFLLEELNEESFNIKTKKKLLRDYENNLFNAFFFYEEERLRGFAVIINNYSIAKAAKTLYLGELYIRKQSRGKGYGKTLFEYVVNYAKSNNYIRLEWRTAKNNLTAQNLYKKYETDNNWIYYVMRLP